MCIKNCLMVPFTLVSMDVCGHPWMSWTGPIACGAIGLDIQGVCACRVDPQPTLQCTSDWLLFGIDKRRFYFFTLEQLNEVVWHRNVVWDESTTRSQLPIWFLVVCVFFRNKLMTELPQTLPYLIWNRCWTCHLPTPNHALNEFSRMNPF